MRLIVRAAVVAAVSGIGLLGVMGGTAQAATGTFDYFSPTTGPGTLTDPAAGCHNLEGPLLGATNNTDAQATLYTDPDCATALGTLDPGAQGAFPEAVSVSFPS